MGLRWGVARSPSEYTRMRLSHQSQESIKLPTHLGARKLAGRQLLQASQLCVDPSRALFGNLAHVPDVQSAIGRILVCTSAVRASET